MNIAVSSPLFLGAYLRVIQENDAWVVSMNEMQFIGPIFQRRWKRARGIFGRAIVKLGARSDEPVFDIASLSIPEASKRRILNKIGLLDKRLAFHLEAPLSPREVEEYLGISGRERLRWTKDGRLPSYTRRNSTRGPENFSIPFYSVDLVHRLKCNPVVFDEWRRSDQNH
jgi:hypothetical protein